jgi:predicted ester cyclase
MKLEPSQLRDFAKRYTSAWFGRDASSVATFYSPSGSLSINGGAPAIGRNAISEVAQGFMTAFPDLEVVMDDVLVQGDNAVYRWTLAGTNTGPGGTGKRVGISGFEVWRIGPDGFIAESQGHFDNAIYQHQLKHGIAEPN